MNKFYQQKLIFQWVIAILLLLIALLPMFIIMIKASDQPLYYLFFIIYIPVAQFAFTPFCTLIGIYRYYSPMLLGYNATDKQIDLHNGTSFDYLMVMTTNKPGIEFRNRLLKYHLEGLLNIIQLIEKKNIPETVNIVGTSYFFNNRTLEKMGFETENPSLFYRINLFLNVIDLIWMYSLSRGKLKIPNISNVKKASTTGKKLIENKDKIILLNRKIKTETIA
ncbi:hypothetical protein [Seramator thermalis]|uniref:hypothetical protein n=1 Tax=Seramator thermalis TaxID=2496270 RepID=UPI00101BB253|nr:hypothetical protein [Seramator thermalis]